MPNWLCWLCLSPLNLRKSGSLKALARNCQDQKHRACVVYTTPNPVIASAKRPNRNRVICLDCIRLWSDSRIRAGLIQGCRSPVLARRRKAAGNDAGINLVPGGTGVRVCSGPGFSATLLSVALASIPPGGTADPQLLVMKVGGGCLLFIAAGLFFYLRNRNAN